jgi:hypothetical protein
MQARPTSCPSKQLQRNLVEANKLITKSEEAVVRYSVPLLELARASPLLALPLLIINVGI